MSLGWKLWFLVWLWQWGEEWWRGAGLGRLGQGLTVWMCWLRKWEQRIGGPTRNRAVGLGQEGCRLSSQKIWIGGGEGEGGL